MTTREQVKALLTASCPGYEVTYEASRMINAIATGKQVDAKFIYIEEFSSGQYKFKPGKPKSVVTRVQIWFCKFKKDADPNSPWRAGAPDVPAEVREKVREEIEVQAVIPFIEKFYASPVFTNKPEYIPFAKVLPRFADGEISVMIELDVQLSGLC